MKSSSSTAPANKKVRPVKSSRVKSSRFARRLLRAWQQLRLPLGEVKIVVAVSGGADSVALLLALDELISQKELQVKLTIAHLDHALRPQSKADATWVATLAQNLGYENLGARINVARRAAVAGDNLEQAARRARYDFLEKAATAANADLLLTAHTLDDQAETILLRLLRGSGAEGLAGMEPVRLLTTPTANLQVFPNTSPTTSAHLLLARPLISWARRSETEEYCRLRKIDYRSDAMNNDETFARVRVRKQLLPLMASYNGKIVEALARTAELLRDDLAVLNHGADLLLLAAESGSRSEDGPPSLRIAVLAQAPAALRRRALRRWISRGKGDLRRVELLHIVAIEKLLQGEKGGRITELPGGARVLRKQQRLVLMLDKSQNKGEKQKRQR